MRTKNVRVGILLVLGSFFSIANSYGANGLYLTAYGAKHTGMGGADIANIEDTNALIANPAGLAQVKSSRSDYSLIFSSISDLSHGDENNSSEVGVSNETALLGGFGYARRLRDDLVVAGSVNVAGGLGYIYEDVETRFNTKDDIEALFSLFRFSFGIGWNIRENFRAGGVVAATYAATEQSTFEDTSFASGQDVFFGAKLEGLSGWGYDAKVGLQYDLQPNLAFGVSYTSGTDIDLDNGEMTVNYEALNMGRVTYKDASLEGLALPEEFGAGLYWHGPADIALGLEANWFDWGGAIDKFEVEASQPDAPAPSNSIRQVSSIKMYSQVVYSIGVQKTLSPGSEIRVGYSYHDLVVSRRTLSPTFALISRHDVSVGYGVQLNSRWQLDTAFAYQPREKVRYSNPELPFGPSFEINESYTLHVTLSRLE